MLGKQCHIRKRIKTKCSIQLNSGHVINGTTRNISIDGAFIECQPIAPHIKVPLKISDSALLIIYIENPQVALKVRCRLNNIFPDGVEIGAQFAYMGKAELALFEQFLKSADD